MIRWFFHIKTRVLGRPRAPIFPRNNLKGFIGSLCKHNTSLCSVFDSNRSCKAQWFNCGKKGTGIPINLHLPLESWVGGKKQFNVLGCSVCVHTRGDWVKHIICVMLGLLYTKQFCLWLIHISFSETLHVRLKRCLNHRSIRTTTN